MKKTSKMFGQCTLAMLFIVLAVVGVQPNALAGGMDATPDAGPRVQTREGDLEGLSLNGLQTFMGIPFAAPPIGEQRWQPPGDVKNWSGTRQAKDFGSACPQRVYDDFDMIPKGRAMDEDCLSLNVSAPNGAADLPVLVMIHGGGFVEGSGEYLFQLAPLMKAKGVIFVTLNYRLAGLGFLAHPELDGGQGVNFGLMDQMAALRWVNRNIAAFGGDPKKVTIVGVSAGAMSVNMLMASPDTKGLIAGAISQSGYGTWARQPRTSNVVALADAPSAEAMGLELASEVTGKPADEVTRKDLYATTAKQWTDVVRGFTMPIIDGITQIEEAAVIFAQGKQHPVPYMSGGTSYDGGESFVISGVSREDLIGMTDGQADRMRKLWAGDFSVSEEQGFTRFFGDFRYLYSAQNMTRSMDNVERSGYLFMFDYVPPVLRAEVPGAPHAADQVTMWSKFDLPVAGAMRDYFFNFMKTGNPNGKGLVPWPAAAESEPVRWIVFEDNTVQKDDIRAQKMAFIDALWRARVAPLLAPQ